MNILVKPVVTEKMNASSEQLRQYGFIVRKEAHKKQIKQEIEELYNVEVVSVNTMIYPGKKKTTRGSAATKTGKTNSYKKAVATLKEGNIIDFYSNI